MKPQAFRTIGNVVNSGLNTSRADLNAALATELANIWQRFGARAALSRDVQLRRPSPVHVRRERLWASFTNLLSIRRGEAACANRFRRSGVRPQYMRNA
jgi:hypothetical protein